MSVRSSVVRVVVLLAVVVASFPAAASAASAGAAAQATPALTDAPASLDWRVCGSFQCSTLTVPLDYANPGGSTIDLALIRAPARDPKQRIGSLLVNPGGPGGSGVDFLRGALSTFDPALRDRFDMVAWDPRGTGRSDPVDCNYDMSKYYALDFSPDSQAERDQLIAGIQAFVGSCVRSMGDTLRHISTDDTVQDLDRIRAALGDDKLSYLGFSYGTEIGAKYAAAFPDKVRALVLDGAVDPSIDATAGQVEQAVGFEGVLDSFLHWCSARRSCAFHRGGKSAAAFDALSARVDADGLPVPRSRPERTLTSAEYELGLASVIYEGRAGFSFLGRALNAADKGDGSLMAELADSYTDRNANGTYGTTEDAFLAISCADGPPIDGLAGARQIEIAAAKAAPRLGPGIVDNSIACALWPFQGPPAAPVHAPGAPPIVVVGTRHDPATPLAWAKSLASQLESGVLVTAPGEQHTAFGTGNTCVDTTVVRYLVDLKAPPRTLDC